MKVLLVSEGPSELNGALQNLVRRLGVTEGDIDIDRVSQRDVHAHHDKESVDPCVSSPASQQTGCLCGVKLLTF
jgi:hypothetical protein